MYRPVSQIKRVSQSLKETEFLTGLSVRLKGSVMQEEWKTIKDYPYYDVSNYGRIRSWRIWHGTTLPRYLKPGIVTGGYLAVALTGNKKIKHLLVHSLVLTAFKGNRPDGMDCCHNDGNPRNNRLDNLRWDTRKSNFNDRKLHGTYPEGERHPNSKFKNIEVIEMRRLGSCGVSEPLIAKMFKTSYRNVHGIIKRDYWRSLK